MLFRLLLAARLLGDTFFHQLIIILINPDRVSLAYAEQCHNDISHNKKHLTNMLHQRGAR